MEKQQEGVWTIYKENHLVAVIKRDEVTKRHLVYLVNEATSDDIANLIVEGKKQ